MREFSLTLNASLDISRHVLNIGQMRFSGDYPVLTEVAAGEMTFTLIDATGKFSPENPDNIFVQFGLEQSGYLVPIAFAYNSEPAWSGYIRKIEQNTDEGTAALLCADIFYLMRRTEIKDIGVPRFADIYADPRFAPGFYPILDGLFPAATDSLVFKKSPNAPLTLVDTLPTSGAPTGEFITNENGIQVYGGEITDAATNYPQVQYKSPFRYLKAETAFKAILEEVDDIASTETVLPDLSSEPHFESRGRPGYDTVEANRGVVSRVWGFYVTDFLQHAGDFYLLCSVRRGDANASSLLLKYDESSGDSEVVARDTEKARGWYQFAKDGTDFYIGTRDAQGGMEILKWDGTDLTTFVPATVSEYKPNLNCRYMIGAKVSGIAPTELDMLQPDSRKKIRYYDSGLFYPYADRARGKFGIAKAVTATARTYIIEADLDNRQNEESVNFDIDAGGLLTGGLTVRKASDSTDVSFQKQL